MEHNFDTEQTVPSAESGSFDTGNIADAAENLICGEEKANELCEKGKPENTGGGKVSAFGKFDSLEQLLKGYAHLEAEFTKRSQKLKELERRSEENLISAEEKERVIQEKLADERFITERIAADEKISDLIISRYLSSVRRTQGAPVLNGAVGISALTPIKKPKSLEEAKRLADILLK